MHLLLSQKGTIYEADEAIDLGQSPADIVFLTSADTELSSLAVAKSLLKEKTASLRLANLLSLSHPFSIDTYKDKTLQFAKLIIVRVLGGENYWQYGLQCLHALAVEKRIKLAILPGCDKRDQNLDKYCTISLKHRDRLWQYLVEGGAQNSQNFLRYCEYILEKGEEPLQPLPLLKAGLYSEKSQDFALEQIIEQQKQQKRPVVAICFYRAFLQSGQLATIDAMVHTLKKRNYVVLPLFVSSLKDDLSVAILDKIFEKIPPDLILNATGFAISNGQSDRQPTILEKYGNMVLQVVFASNSRENWQKDNRGLMPRDLAMNVALTEVDGRVFTRAVSFKTAALFDEETQCNIIMHEPHYERIKFVCAQVEKWLNLKFKKPKARNIALIMANYPGGDGRLGHGVGLDTPASTLNVLKIMKKHGYAIENIPKNSHQLMKILQKGPTNLGVEGRIIRHVLSLKDYRKYFQKLDTKIKVQMLERWGEPETDAYCTEKGFALPIYCVGKIVIGLQPERAYGMDAKHSYHAQDIVPSHHYLAFYFWLRFHYQADAIVHMGKHGNLEWLPGKSLALSKDCYPEIALGTTPHIYPFIVNDPGEGTQAKRRASAVIIDHLTPPLTRAESYGPLKDLEVLVDEYYEASGVDPRRLPKLKGEILSLLHITGLKTDAGIGENDNDDLALEKLDAFLCDLKELQIRDGLHIFGKAPKGAKLNNLLVALSRVSRGGEEKDSLHRAIAKDLELDFDPLDCAFEKNWTGKRPDILSTLTECPWRSFGDTVERIENLALQLVSKTIKLPKNMPRTKAVLNFIQTSLRKTVVECGKAEIDGLLCALNGQFVPPAPSGAPTRGRLDVLPTGRNFFSVDTRAIPTFVAWKLGKNSAENLIKRYVQDNGEWPKAFGLTAWGTANMRTGGDDIAQALALIGVKPLYDSASRRVSGYEIIPISVLGRPRVDVTLRVSGFFRDAFPEQMRLFDQAIRAVAFLDENFEDNPIALHFNRDKQALLKQGYDENSATDFAAFRIFGNQKGTYGTGVQELLNSGNWQNKQDISQVWIANSSYAYGLTDGVEAKGALENQLQKLDAVVQNQDNREHDLLDSGEYFAFEGGLACAILEKSGKNPTIYHNDLSRTERPLIKTLEEEIGRTLYGRALNPKWLKSAIEHGFKGAVEMAATVDYLFSFAATTFAVKNHHFDAIYDAYIDDENIQNFLKLKNPAALQEIAEKFIEAIERKLWIPRSNFAQFALEKLAKGEKHGDKNNNE